MIEICLLTVAEMGQKVQPVYMTIEEFCEQYYRKTKAAVLTLHSRNPEALPPIVNPPGTRHLLFKRSEVEEWMEAHKKVHAPKKARRGRPRLPATDKLV